MTRELYTILEVIRKIPWFSRNLLKTEIHAAGVRTKAILSYVCDVTNDEKKFKNFEEIRRHSYK